MTIQFQALPTEKVRELQNGGTDANNMPVEKKLSEGSAPCRHCLTNIEKGRQMLVLAYCPFETRQPYAEVGPIFLCASQCHKHPETNQLPEMFRRWQKALIRGYSNDHRIVYGSGKMVDMADLEREAEAILTDPDVSYIHMRSGSYNCYQCKITRA
ncbi:DUF1203 domain-containing protein [Neptunicella sp. SCSIO 80796]|uniref:DUF1203 domain-containing protein n=1 Tax=Neptunicella plasticusilytica TaxID=3117012 RepID=UPI003A4D710D